MSAMHSYYFRYNLMWESKMANSEDGKLELLTHKNSILILVDYQLSMFKSIGEGDDSSRKLTIVFGNWVNLAPNFNLSW